MYDTNTPGEQKVSKKSWWVTFWLLLLGPLCCCHRFYVGKVGTGVIWMLTYGCFFVGAIMDLIKLCKGQFTDKEGLPIVRQSK